MVIELEKGKNYAVRFYYIDCFGKRQRPYKSGFPSREKALLWEMQEKARLEGATVGTPNMTFGELHKLWRESRIKKNLSIKTLEKYDRYSDDYILPFLEDTPVHKITDRTCQAIIDKNLTSPANCIEIKKVMNGCFNYAIKKRWLKENPFSIIDMPTYKPLKVDPYGSNDIIDLLDKLYKANSKLYTPVLCACLFAATREEVCALNDIDITHLDDGTYRIRIDKALVSLKGETYLVAQKTENRRRHFLFGQEIYDELHYYKKNNNIISPYLCCCRDGSNIQPNSISNEFANFIKKNNLKHTSFHRLRKSFANTCKRLGVDLDSVFRMMGHSSYKITAEHYATADDILIHDAVSRIETAILKPLKQKREDV